MHVCYVTCRLYSYVQNMRFYPCHIATLLRVTCWILGEPLLQDQILVAHRYVQRLRSLILCLRTGLSALRHAARSSSDILSKGSPRCGGSARSGGSDRSGGASHSGGTPRSSAGTSSSDGASSSSELGSSPWIMRSSCLRHLMSSSRVMPSSAPLCTHLSSYLRSTAWGVISTSGCREVSTGAAICDCPVLMATSLPLRVAVKRTFSCTCAPWSCSYTSAPWTGTGSSGSGGKSHSAICPLSWYIFHHTVKNSDCCQNVQEQQLPCVDFLSLRWDSLIWLRSTKVFMALTFAPPWVIMAVFPAPSVCLCVQATEAGIDVFHVGCLMIWDTFTLRCLEVERISSPFGGSYIPIPGSAWRTSVPDLGCFVNKFAQFTVPLTFPRDNSLACNAPFTYNSHTSRWRNLAPWPMRFEAWIADELSVHRRGFPHTCPKSRVMRSFRKIPSRAARETPRSSASGTDVAGKPGWVWVVQVTTAPATMARWLSVDLCVSRHPAQSLPL